MISKNPTFAKYSKPFCWVVAAAWFLIGLAVITGDSDNRVLIGLLWLAGAAAFAVSALYLDRFGKGDDSGAAN
ncbi:MAG: hypothetical protein RLZZ385_1731 [Pseudomonadota bacterium]|jgi:hypothetical protein